MRHPAPALEGVRRIAVFRALVLGDMLCASPALRALRSRFPQAHITLVGLPWACEWVGRLNTVDDFVAFPGHPELPERVPDLKALPGFMERMQGLELDLAVQLHGSGQTVNGLVATWCARHVAAFCEPGQYCPEPTLSCPWPREGTEVQRLLALTDVLGAPRLGEGLDWPILPVDREAAASLIASHASAGRQASTAYVCVHAGAQLASRRWTPSSFARVADMLAESGLTVILTGVPHEQALGAEIRAAMTQPCIDLIGKTTLWSMGALIEGARLLVCNDTGVSHVAAAVGTPSVVVSCGGDVARWAPADVGRHRVLWAPRECRPCGHATCPYAHECATQITPADVWPVVQAALAA